MTMKKRRMREKAFDGEKLSGEWKVVNISRRLRETGGGMKGVLFHWAALSLRYLILEYFFGTGKGYQEKVGYFQGMGGG